VRSKAERWGLALAGVFVVALAWRAAFLARLLRSPLADHLQGDEHIYWDWSMALIDHHFRATNAFFLGPLYPYALALLRLAVGSEIARVAIAQSLLGAVAAVLLTDAARRVARPAVALAIGVVLATYEMFVLHDAVILMESLLLFLEASLLWLVARNAGRDMRAATLVGMGLVVGLAAECRATSALLLLPVAWVVLQGSAQPRRVLASRWALLAAGFLVAVVPGAWSNARTAHEFIPFTYNLGFNLYVGNNPRATGGYVDITEGLQQAAVPAGRADGGAQTDGREFLAKQRGLTLSPAQSSAYWAAQARRFAGENPGAVAMLVVKKALLLVNHSEVSQIESAELYRRFAGPLGLPLLGSFLFIGPLGLAGAVVAGRAGVYGRYLRLHLATAICGVLPFFVTDRYRVHLVPVLGILAALAIEQLVARRDVQRLALACAGAVVLVALPVRGDEAHREEWTNWRDIGTNWAEHGETGRAIETFERALEEERRWGFDHDPDPAVARIRAQLAFNYAVALHQTGRDADALRWFESAARDDPGDSRYARTLADAYRAAGQAGAADSLERALPVLVGGEAQSLIRDGWQAMRDGRPAAAESLFTRAVAADQNQFGAWMALVRVQVERGEYAAAQSTLARASRLRVPEPMLDAHAALVAAAMGDTATARAALARIPIEALAGDRLLAGVVAEARRRLGE